MRNNQDMSQDQIELFVRDLLSALGDYGVYVLEREPDDVVVDGAFDPSDVAEELARKWTITRKSE